MQEFIRRRKRAGFVGRRDELALFRENFDFPPADERHRFIFHIRGNAGVGKTSLVQQFQEASRERKAITSYVDEAVSSVPEAMAAIGAHFARQGHALKALERMLATYRERRYEAESASVAVLDPQQPPGPSAGSMAAAQAGLFGLGMVPGIGALAGVVDPAHLAQGADRLRAALSARFRNQEDVQLVMDPLQVLTPVLVAEVGRLAAGVPWFTLFFDTYERTGPFLDTWLRDLITTERYGALPANVIVTLAGQRQLDAGCWADHMDFVADLPLEPFTESEARQLLAAKGVVNEGVVQDVLRLSGRLPVLVSTLAENQPADPADVGDPSATAVGRFLKWEQDPVRRAAALACALPRRLNEDVFRAAVEADAAGLFGWLRSLPFVSDRGGSAQYHDVVRNPMLRLQRNSSPQRWSSLHTRLAEAFAGWREAAGAGVDPEELWEQARWCELRLQESYHLLCAQPQGALPTVLRDGVDACDDSTAEARRWGQVLAEAGEDADADALRQWGEDCLAALADEKRGTIRVLGLLLSRAGLDTEGQVSALVARARDLRDAQEYPAALLDYERAIALEPGRARAYLGRGLTRQALGEFDLALADMNRADELRPGTWWIIRERGETHRLADRFEEAVADLDRALELDPTDAWSFASRGQTNQQRGRYAEALVDFDRAIQLDPDYPWALVRRAQARGRLGDIPGALTDLDRAEELSPDTAWIPGQRGDTYRLDGRYDEAIAAYGVAIDRAPDYAFAFAGRGRAHREAGRFAQALADLDHALDLDGEYAWALVERGRVRRALDDADGERADLDRAVEIEPGNAWTLAERGEAHRVAGRYPEALADFDRAIVLDPGYGWALGSRGQTRRALGRYEEALADLDRADELQPEEAWILADRGGVHRAMGRFEEAYADLDRAIEVDPEYVWAYVRRAALDLTTGRLQRALAGLDRCLQLGFGSAWVHRKRASALLFLGRPEEALAALDLAEREGAEPVDFLGLRSEACRLTGRFEPAREAAERLLTEEPSEGSYYLALVVSRTQGVQQAAELWRDAERHYPRTDPAALTCTEAGELMVVLCGQGEWERADALLEEFLAGDPAWEDPADALDAVTELLGCPGADTGQLERFRSRLAEATAALAPADASDG
ncbi:tetratricopeptide repeat protein [Streptomyces sp. NBC_01210]|uniref:tetratricopeptide repeat protein n=1 Tax=Streptomyces sp. NBC_01210 TaxID=2903774 RepID=UPI002E13C4AA|nr:tetratricopeptide repeat protein [Streptomyces sp. NBC_01210]